MSDARWYGALLLATSLVAGVGGCRRASDVSASEGGGGAPVQAASAPRVPSEQERAADVALAAEESAADARVALGRRIFFDASLSEPAGTSCGSCHEPGRAYSGVHGSSAGVPRGSRSDHLARRTAPSLLYLKYVPKFHFALEDDDAPAPAPFGGLFWDGRVDTISELVRQPMLNPDEMNNHDLAGIAKKVLAAPYAGAIEQALGTTRAPERVVQVLSEAVEAFLTTEDMAPFSSRYDDFVRGRAKLSTLELYGMQLFKDASKGGCVGCHLMNETATDPALSLFSDYGYDAVAVPPNSALPRHRKPDLGLCERSDKLRPSSEAANCAHFRTPSLRNVALRTSYMHNGTFKSLRDVVEFYATRATDPLHWYKSGVRFEDVPAQYRQYVNKQSIPYNRREGDAPALDAGEIDAIVAFLQTLTDAHLPSGEAAPVAVAR